MNLNGSIQAWSVHTSNVDALAVYTRRGFVRSID
jgi:hypothetical protein